MKVKLPLILKEITKKTLIYCHYVDSIVEIVIPITFIESNGERRSWCQMRYERIKYKKTIADAAVDGVILEEHIRTQEQAFEDYMTWVKRLEA